MKRKTLLAVLMALTVSCFALTACGEAASEQTTRSSNHSSNDAEDDEEEADDEEKDDEDDDRSSSNGDERVFVGESESYEADPDYGTVAYEQHVELHVADDGTATIMQISESSEGTSTMSYTGKFTVDGDKYTVETMDAYGEAMSCCVYVDGSKVVNFDYSYGSDVAYDFSDFVGTHTADTECGTLSFEVDENELVGGVVYVDDVELEGSLIIYGVDDNYDLMFTDADDVYHDWYIYPEGDTFTYEDYNDACEREKIEQYKEFAGDYEYTGALGDIVITISEAGASTTLDVDGETLNLENGDASIYEGNLDSVYFGSEDGVSVSISLYEDGTYSVDMYQSFY